MLRVWPLLIVTILAACAAKQDSSELVQVRGFWGHLDDIEETTPSHMLLSQVAPGSTYTICLAKYMVDRFPGIQSEIEASVNIWGHYINRKIPLTVEVKNISPPVRGETSESLRDRLYRECGKSYDLVVSTAFLQGNTVGQTSSSYSYSGVDSQNRQKLKSFKRVLVLRESRASDAQQVDWVTLQQYMQKSFSSDEIIELMKNRNTTSYLTGDDQLLTLRTLVHEFGHVWGLCDQYALTGSRQTNCDPENSLINERNHILLVQDSTMYSSRSVSQLYLLNDDIDGIRKLGERDSFNIGWDTPDNYNALEPKPIVRRPIEFVDFRNPVQTDGELKFDFSLVTTSPFRYTFSLRRAGSENWVSFSTRESSGGVDWVRMEYTLRKSSGLNADKLKLTLGLLSKPGTVSETKEYSWDVPANPSTEEAVSE